MRLNWFSPRPPDESLLAGLAALADVVVLTGREPSPPWADLSVYELGDDADRYGGIWQAFRQEPGVVVLHDISLARLVVGSFRRQHDFGGYREAMERSYGSVGGRLAAEVGQRGGLGADVAERCPHTRPAVDGALGVLVHTPAAMAVLRPGVRCPIACQPPSPMRQYADALSRLCAEALRYRVRAAGMRLAERAAAAMSPWAGPRPERLSEHVARHVVSLTG